MTILLPLRSHPSTTCVPVQRDGQAFAWPHQADGRAAVRHAQPRFNHRPQPGGELGASNGQIRHPWKGQDVRHSRAQSAHHGCHLWVAARHRRRGGRVPVAGGRSQVRLHRAGALTQAFRRFQIPPQALLPHTRATATMQAGNGEAGGVLRAEGHTVSIDGQKQDVCDACGWLTEAPLI